MDDGLLTSNMLLRGDCTACSHTFSHPHLVNVLVTSVQPERNIQLFTHLGEEAATPCDVQEQSSN